MPESLTKKQLNEELLLAICEKSTNGIDVGRLVDAGADPDAKDENEDPFIHLAILSEYAAAQKTAILIKKGADIFAETYRGETALYSAASLKGSEGVKIVRMLLEHARHTQTPERVEKYVNTIGPTYNDCNYAPVHQALAAGNKETAALLFAAGADLNIKVDGGYFKRLPLRLAAREGSVEVLEAFVRAAQEMGSEYAKDFVNKQSGETGNTALHEAVKEGRPLKSVQLLLAAGANVYAINHAGDNPVHVAAARGAPATLKLLIKAAQKEGSIDCLSAQSFYGSTPMNIAFQRNTRYGNVIEIRKLLREAGAVTRLEAEKALEAQQQSSRERRGIGPIMAAGYSGGRV